MKIKTETIIRTTITIIALLNSVLVMLGKSPLPWSNEELYESFSAFLAVCTTLWSWWKNNSFTKSAIRADRYMEDLKNENKGN